MSDLNDSDERRPDDPASGTPPPDATPAPASDPLERIEHGVERIRAALDADLRDARHRDFSPALLAAVLAQAIVVALLGWAAIDCLTAPLPAAVILVKLAFAGVLQLIALTGFASVRTRR